MAEMNIGNQAQKEEDIVGSVLGNDFNIADDEDNTYNNEDDYDPSTTEEYPRIMLMGLRRSGKSSIQKVVFHKMSPNETLFLESTNKIEKSDVSDCSFIKFHIWDFPGQFDLLDPIYDIDSMLQSSKAIVFVIDAQDNYTDALARLNRTISLAYRVNRNIKIEVFIHKVDSLNDEQKIDIQRDIAQKSTDDIADNGLENVQIGFHLTTIYDHSIFEAFSKVVQKLIPYLEVFENILNAFIINSNLEKAFLFDVASKIYLATDSMIIIDMQTYELCCDMIDVVVDIASIYNPKVQLIDPVFSEYTSSIIRLNNETVLYLRGVNKYLALVCLMREEALEKQGTIEFNFEALKWGIQKVLKLKLTDVIGADNDKPLHHMMSETSLEDQGGAGATNKSFLE